MPGDSVKSKSSPTRWRDSKATQDAWARYAEKGLGGQSSFASERRTGLPIEIVHGDKPTSASDKGWFSNTGTLRAEFLPKEYPEPFSVKRMLGLGDENVLPGKAMIYDYPGNPFVGASAKHEAVHAMLSDPESRSRLAPISSDPRFSAVRGSIAREGYSPEWVPGEVPSFSAEYANRIPQFNQSLQDLLGFLNPEQQSVILKMAQVPGLTSDAKPVSKSEAKKKKPFSSDYPKNEY